MWVVLILVYAKKSLNLLVSSKESNKLYNNQTFKQNRLICLCLFLFEISTQETNIYLFGDITELFALFIVSMICKKKTRTILELLLLQKSEYSC